MARECLRGVKVGFGVENGEGGDVRKGNRRVGHFFVIAGVGGE